MLSLDSPKSSRHLYIFPRETQEEFIDNISSHNPFNARALRASERGQDPDWLWLREYWSCAIHSFFKAV
jgi:hypothetical protein